MTTATATVNVNRDATPDDAATLAAIYDRLSDAIKAKKDAERALSEGWVSLDLLPSLRAARDAAITYLDRVMDESWDAIQHLPAGTVASGGANRQTVALEFFNRNLNRGLKLRMTAAEAKKLNKASFRL